MGVLLIILGLIVYVILGTLWSAFVLSQLWAWFVVPFGIMTLGLAHAWGLSLLIRMFTYHADHSQSDGKNLGSKLALPFLIPLFALIFGFIAKSFM